MQCWKCRTVVLVQVLLQGLKWLFSCFLRSMPFTWWILIFNFLDKLGVFVLSNSPSCYPLWMVDMHCWKMPKLLIRICCLVLTQTVLPKILQGGQSGVALWSEAVRCFIAKSIAKSTPSDSNVPKSNVLRPWLELILYLYVPVDAHFVKGLYYYVKCHKWINRCLGHVFNFRGLLGGIQ